MTRINENKLAKEVTLREGGKINLSIGQIKEVQKHLLDILANDYRVSEICELLERHLE